MLRRNSASREKGGRCHQDWIVSSWIDLAFQYCSRLMQTEDFALSDKWTANWRDLVDFEIVPVHTSAEAVEVISQRCRTLSHLPGVCTNAL